MRIIGFDPDHEGSTWAIVDFDGDRPRFVAAGWLRVAPKEVLELLADWSPTGAAVELTHKPRLRREWTRRERKQHVDRLKRTRKHSGELAHILHTKDIPVFRIPAWSPLTPHQEFREGSWRRCLTGIYKPNDSDVRRALRNQVAGLPYRAHSHLYDAVGIAVVAADHFREQLPVNVAETPLYIAQ